MRAILGSAALVLAVASTPAAAQVPVPGTGLDISGEASVLSDYRFRGISRSDEDPALQANVTVSHGSGFYLGTRASSLEGLDRFRFRDPEFEDLGDVEFDLYAGYGTELGAGLSADAGLMYYYFAGGEGETDYFEPYASLSYLLGPVEATAGAKYAPSQDAIGNEDMLYVFGEVQASIPLTGFSVTAQAGRQHWGRYGGYWNWSLGGAYSIGPAEIGLRYVDTDLPALPGQDAGIIASLGFRF